MKKKITKGKLKPTMKKGMHQMPDGEMMENYEMMHTEKTPAKRKAHERKESKKKEKAEEMQETEYGTEY